MKKLLIILTAFLLFVCQTSLGESIDILGVSPNLILIFSIVYSLDSTNYMAILTGCICGLMSDLADNEMVGVSALLMMYISFGAGIASKKFYYDNKLVGLIIVFVSSIVFEFSKFFIINLLYNEVSAPVVFFRFVLPGAVYNSILSIPLMWWINKLKNEYIRGI